MKLFILSFISLVFSIQSYSQGIKGTITDSNNQPIAYVNIYVPELKTGTTSNIDGHFELKLPPGEWDVLFQYIGFKTKKHRFKIANIFENIEVIIEPQPINIKEIKVLASGEDPAYYVMRRAIAMAPYYTNQISEYNSKLYLKGNGMIYKIPRLFKKKMEKEGVEINKPFVFESLNKIHFELPDKLDQEVIAMRSSGDDKNTNPMEMVTTNLYNVSKYGIVSPVGRYAMKKYNFKLEGVFEDQNKLINKIKVTPKVNGKGTFEGYITIVENTWNIHSADLKFKMPFMDVVMHQIYGMVDENTWMPTSLDFEMDMSGLGFGMKYNYVAAFSEYQVTLNNKLDHSFLKDVNEKQKEEQRIIESLTNQEEFLVQIKPQSPKQKKIETLLKKEDLSNREMYKLEKLLEKEVERSLPPKPLEIKERVKVNGNVIKNDSSFWSELRPIPLTNTEDVTFAKKDSILLVHGTQEYKDSIRDVKQKFKIKDLILGRTYKYEKDSARFKSKLSTSGILHFSDLNFNTVDGFKLSLPFSYHLTDTMGRRFSVNSKLAYGFSRKAIDAEILAYYLFNGIKRSWVQVSGGRTTADYKNTYIASSLENSFYTLYREDNFQKFYEKQFIHLQGGTEISNGLKGSVGFQISKRSSLRNHSDFKFHDRENFSYTPNFLQIPGLENWNSYRHSATSATLRLHYTPNQRYRIRKKFKYAAGSKYPTFNLIYKKGFKNILESKVNYDYLELGIKQNLKIGFNSFLNYNLISGKFLNRKSLYAQDLKYFNSNNRMLSFSSSYNKFRLLDYYEAVSANYFSEGHLSLNFEKLLLKRLPLFNRTMLRENLFLNYLNTEQIDNYVEIGYGLKGIFLLIDAEVIVGFDKGKYRKTGLMVSINLP